MLTDVHTSLAHLSSLADILSVISAGGAADADERGNPNAKRLTQGVYEIHHFSFDQICTTPLMHWKDLGDTLEYRDYGVCDHYTQILEQFPQLLTSPRRFVVSVTPLEKSQQSPRGGWRWHKWGPYIGTQTPTTEYLYDEPEIEKVYVFHVYELEDGEEGA